MVLESILVSFFYKWLTSFPGPLVKEVVFFPLYILGSFVEDKVSVGLWIYLWAFYSVPLIYISRVKQITSPGWMHETSARGWCTGKTHRDWVEKEVGGGIGMGNTCKSMADSCQCMAKTTTIL